VYAKQFHLLFNLIALRLWSRCFLSSPQFWS